MGTRGCVGWTFDGKKIVETYNHFDSYPRNLGVAMLETINSVDLTLLEERLASVEHITDSGVNAPAKLAKKYAEFAGDLSGHSKTEWYNLLRELQGARQLIEIAKGTVTHAIVNEGWMKNALYCEYSYVVNFKTHKVDCYEAKGVKKYRSVKVGSIPFDMIKRDVNVAKDMLKTIYKLEEL